MMNIDIEDTDTVVETGFVFQLSISGAARF